MEQTNDTIITYNKGVKEYYNSRNRYWHAQGYVDKYINNSKNILDIGCGPGILINSFTKLNYLGAYIGYDKSTEMINFAKKKFPKYSFVHDLDDIPNNQFDLVFILATLHHLSNEEITTLFNCLKEKIINKSKIVITIWNIKGSKYYKKAKFVSDNSYLLPLNDCKGNNLGDRLYYEYSFNDIIRLILKIKGYYLHKSCYLDRGKRNFLFEFVHLKDEN